MILTADNLVEVLETSIKTKLRQEGFQGWELKTGINPSFSSKITINIKSVETEVLESPNPYVSLFEQNVNIVLIYPEDSLANEKLPRFIIESARNVAVNNGYLANLDASVADSTIDDDGSTVYVKEISLPFTGSNI